MLQRNRELIDQFNRDEQRWHRLRWRKVKRRVRFPKLGALSHAMLDLLFELREKRRPADCVSGKHVSEGRGARHNNGGQVRKKVNNHSMKVRPATPPETRRTSPPQRRRACPQGSIGVTDNDWFAFLSRQQGIDEVNFLPKTPRQKTAGKP